MVRRELGHRRPAHRVTDPDEVAPPELRHELDHVGREGTRAVGGLVVGALVSPAPRLWTAMVWERSTR
jgi:hypothetical protein